MSNSSQQNLVENLRQAVATGELVSIIYHGGSQPGAVREIRPIKVSETEVWAYDDTTRPDGTEQAKKFFVSKIELPSNDEQLRQYDSNFVEARDSRTIKEIFEPIVAQFQAMGYFVALNLNEISLHSYFKNGKVRKAASIILRFDEFITDLIFDEDKWIAGIEDGTSDFIESVRKSKRPYHVVSPTYRGSGFSKLSHAVTVFLDEAEKHRPKSLPPNTDASSKK